MNKQINLHFFRRTLSKKWISPEKERASDEANPLSDVGSDGVGEGFLVLNAEDDLVVPVNEEVRGQDIDAVVGGRHGTEGEDALTRGIPLAVSIVYANPGEVIDGHAPVMLVVVKPHLVDFKPLVGVLVVELAQREDAHGRCFLGVGAEAEQHHLPLEVGEAALGAVGVGQADVDERSLHHLVGKEGGNAVVSGRACGARGGHALDGNVVEVLRAQGVGVIEVEVRSHGSKGAHVVARADGVEDEAAAQPLEECEVGVGFARVGVDVLEADAVLVRLHEVFNLFPRDAHLGPAVAHKGADSVLQLNLFHHKLLQLHVVVRPFHLIRNGHGGQGGVDADGLRGVDADVDEFAVDAQAVEVVALGTRDAERERAVSLQLDGVGDGDFFDAERIEVEGFSFGFGDGTFDGCLGCMVAANNE